MLILCSILKIEENFFGNIFFRRGEIISVNRVCGALSVVAHKRLNAANAFIIKVSRDLKEKRKKFFDKFCKNA